MDSFWTPGFWAWKDNRFVWIAGYWANPRPGWVWVPGSFSWTPQGYAHVNGYWDYDLSRRGLTFAPLAVSQPAQSAGSQYTPSVAIDPAALSLFLFVRPANGSYYFGDYYDDAYIRRGIYPWFGANRFPDYSYDPLLAYDTWLYGRRDSNWLQDLERWDTYYRQHPEARPPHNLAAEQRIAEQTRRRPKRDFFMIGRPLGTVWQNSLFPMRLARLSEPDRRKAWENEVANRDIQVQRFRTESASAQSPATGGRLLASASDGPHGLLLPRHVQITATNAPNAFIGAQQSQGQNVSTIAGNGPDQSRLTFAGQLPVRREVSKPILPLDDGSREGGEAELDVPPAQIPEPALQSVRGLKRATF
jgi:hypothetical protein